MSRVGEGLTPTVTADEIIDSLLHNQTISEKLPERVGWFFLGPKPEEGYRGYRRPDEMMTPLAGLPVALREGWQDQDSDRLLVRMYDILSVLKSLGTEVDSVVLDYWLRLTEHPEYTNLVLYKSDGRIELFESEVKLEP